MSYQDAREMGREMAGGMGETEGAGTAGGTSTGTGTDEETWGSTDQPLDEAPGAGADESGLASGGLDEEDASPA